jgi:hypothetical protein
MLSHRAKRVLGLMPRKKYYSAHKKDLLEKQKARRQREKENVQKALEQLSRLEKLQQEKSDREVFESQAVKKILREQIKEDREDKEKIEGSNPWQ